MKISQVLLGLFLLFGFINLSTDDPEIRNLEVLQEYTFVTLYDNYYFRVPVTELDDMYVRITAKNTGRNSQNDFKFDICGFNSRPTDYQVMKGHDYCANYNLPEMDYGSPYVTYVYSFSTLENINYLAFSLYMQTNIRPNTIYIYSEKSSIAVILLLVILLPCIIIAAVVVVVCRFCCGGCRIRINAGGGSTNYI